MKKVIIQTMYGARGGLKIPHEVAFASSYRNFFSEDALSSPCFFQNMSTKKAATEEAGRRTRARGINSGNLADRGERIRGVRVRCQKLVKGINGLFFLCR
jgi:hypothetical protein